MFHLICISCFKCYCLPFIEKRDNHKLSAMSVSFELKGFSKKSFQYELLMIVSQKTHQNSQFDDTLKKVFIIIQTLIRISKHLKFWFLRQSNFAYRPITYTINKINITFLWYTSVRRQVLSVKQ